MNRLICVLAVIGVATAQRWGNEGGYKDESYSAPRRPVQPAPLAHDGRVIDTPEISNLKAAHFAAHDAAIKALPPNRGYQQEYRQPEYRPQEQQQRFQEYRVKEYGGPQEFNNKINEDYDNYDDRDSSGYQGNEKEEPRWRGPYAKIEFTEDGKFIKDTPEVHHARQQHLAALSAAKSSPLYQPEPPTNNNNYEQSRYDEGRNNGNERYQVNQGYQGEGGFDDGQYRQNQGKSWQGAGNQYAQRPQGYYN